MFKNRFSLLNRREKVQKIRSELDNFSGSHLALTVNAINERDRHFANGIFQRSRPNDHLHLKDVALRLAGRYQMCQNAFLVQPERSSQVRSVGSEKELREEICTSGDQLPFEVPAVNTTVALVASSADDVEVVFLLEFDELWNELWL